MKTLTVVIAACLVLPFVVWLAFLDPVESQPWWEEE